MNLSRPWALGLTLLLGFVSAVHAAEPAAKRATENVVLMMTDGLRWQEVFGGAEEALLNKENGGVQDVDALKKLYWRDTPEARREALMPFLWTTVGKMGQIYGNQAKGSVATVTNGMKFSYPGYNETLCGFPDPRIDSNDKNLNPNVTVFEWLNRKPQFNGKTAAVTCWDVFPYIFNFERCGFPVNSANDPLVVSPTNPRIELINRMKADTTNYFRGESWDSFVKESALEYIKQEKPRLFFLSLGETDSWCHAGRYDLYLRSAHAADAAFKNVWELLQSIPQYHGKTSIIFVPDHGRGDAPVEWKNHGKKVPRSEYIWMAFLGPDTPALGERSNVPTVTQGQVAATLAALLGEDYATAVPQAAKPGCRSIGLNPIKLSVAVAMRDPLDETGGAQFAWTRWTILSEYLEMHGAIWLTLALSVCAQADEIVQPKVLDPRLKIELFVAEPDIVTPTGIAVDAKGRVFAVESHTHFGLATIKDRRPTASACSRMPTAMAAQSASRRFSRARPGR